MKKTIADYAKRCFSVLLSAAILLSLWLPSLPIIFKAGAAEDHPGLQRDIVIVSLGDSYSSGEGIEDFYGLDADMKKQVTNQDWLAHRSQNGWPGMLKVNSSKLAKNARDTQWYFAAASGATTYDITGRQEKKYQKHDPNNILSHRFPLTDKTYLDPQIDIFDKVKNDGRQADYVTFTLGGNDADFVGILLSASYNAPSLNLPNFLQAKLNKVWNEFYKSDGIRDHLYNTYHKISNAAGKQATLIVVGYPRLLAPKGGGIIFHEEEAALINASVTRFNKEIEAIVNRCKAEGMKICFVDVEEKFGDNGAYSDNSLLNPVMLGAKSQDLDDWAFMSSYSMHPNLDGAKVYADCVNKKIAELEETGGRDAQPVKQNSDVRDVVLVLDVSGSMDGTPINETIKAGKQFVSTVLKEDASIGVVCYDSSAQKVADFSKDGYYLSDVIDRLNAGGGTNIESGLRTAETMLDESNAKKKIIVLMSDGDANQGLTGDRLIEYANTIKEKGVYVYTLGFFSSLNDKTGCQRVMEGIASEGCHYEVDDADQLVFFFGDIADQIRGQQYIYIRIACPVDVTVSYNGQKLSSKNKEGSQRADFGTLTFEENEKPNENSTDDRVKILRLKDNGADYDVKIEGNGKGRMTYSIGFMNEDGEYKDMRKFKNINITKKTEIQTVAKNADTTVLKVDEDGDGKIDYTYKAKAHGNGKLVKPFPVLYVCLGAGALLLIALAFILIRKRVKAAALNRPAPVQAADAGTAGAPAAPKTVRKPKPARPANAKRPGPASAQTADIPKPPRAKNRRVAQPAARVKFCPDCGYKMEIGAAFCPECGKRFPQ